MEVAPAPGEGIRRQLELGMDAVAHAPDPRPPVGRVRGDAVRALLRRRAGGRPHGDAVPHRVALVDSQLRREVRGVPAGPRDAVPDDRGGPAVRRAPDRSRVRHGRIQAAAPERLGQRGAGTGRPPVARGGPEENEGRARAVGPQVAPHADRPLPGPSLPAARIVVALSLSPDMKSSTPAPGAVPAAVLADGADLSRTAVVVIGRNEGQRLKSALESVVGRGVPVIYVDSGSSDGSPGLARSMGVDVVELDLARPLSASRARNEGFERILTRNVRVEFVQFLDGDCALAETWLDRGVLELERRPEVAIAC